MKKTILIAVILLITSCSDNRVTTKDIDDLKIKKASLKNENMEIMFKIFYKTGYLDSATKTNYYEEVRIEFDTIIQSLKH